MRILTRDYRKQIQLAVRAGVELGASELQVRRTNHSATLPPSWQFGYWHLPSNNSRNNAGCISDPAPFLFLKSGSYHRIRVPFVPSPYWCRSVQSCRVVCRMNLTWTACCSFLLLLLSIGWCIIRARG